MTKQKNAFLEGEGDKYFERNHSPNQGAYDYQNDNLFNACCEVLEHPPSGETDASLLEIGCGEGARLKLLSNRFNIQCFGVDPSEKAASEANAKGVIAFQGTADELPFDDACFDIVVFGFCLYLCDREDLFQIASEADRVLKSEGWLIIHDFYAEHQSVRAYHHSPGLSTFKMDYRTLFDWHPHYTCYRHDVRAHLGGKFTDDPQEWVATSIMRKTKILLF